MFENFNRKMKTLAEVILIGGSVLSILLSIGFFITINAFTKALLTNIFYSLSILVIGMIFSIITSFFIYGFGEIISILREIRIIDGQRINQMILDRYERNKYARNDSKNQNIINNKTADNVNDGSNN